MDKIVENFLREQKEADRLKHQNEKNRVMLELGLVQKVYSDNIEYTEDFPYSEFDAQKGRLVWYQVTGANISDEEYEEVKKYARHIPEEKGNNSVALMLKVIAWIVFIGGFILGIVLGSEAADYNSEFAFSVALIYWGIALVSGTLFLGFAEVINLLEAIKRKD